MDGPEGDPVAAGKSDVEEVTSREPVAKRKQAEWFEIDESQNTSLYVSGLPPSMSEDEFVDLMKRYGIIAKKLTPGNPYNIKMYKDSEGSFKGDALCRFVRVESVELALTHLDGYIYDDQHTIHCERAKFECKGSYDPSKKPRIDPKTKVKHKKAIEKLLSWEPKLPPEVKQKKVILKHMFTPEEFIESPDEIIELREDVESKCSELIAEPKRVDVYSEHPEGVVAITFSEAEHAQACVNALNNKFYAGRVVTAELWDGKSKYKIKETYEDSERRLEKWKQDIQESDDGDDEHKAGSVDMSKLCDNSDATECAGDR